MSAGFGAALDRMAAAVGELAPAAAERAAVAACDEARARSPVRTGRLRDGWTIMSAGDGGVRVVNPVPYAAAVEYGGPDRAPQPMARAAAVAAAAAVPP